ncbi:MlaD family protein [Shewanella sp.]|uniref:MlaD family protein n=1 Tax=Shewanella sp. TaxID=50422 RepID=UPI0040545D82
MTKPQAKNQRLPFAIGAFILGAILLIFMALLFFSGGRLFAEKEPVIMYFDGSVQGLQVGAAVKLKGVIIGEISDIRIDFPSDSSQKVTAAVSANLLLERIKLKGIQVDADFFSRAIHKGLRAQLNFQSLLTGLLYVELDFYPNTPIHLRGEQDNLLELPTIATGFELFSQDFQSIDFKGLVNNLDKLTQQLSQIATSGQIQRTLTSFDTAAKAVETTASEFNHTQASLEKNAQVVLERLDKLLLQISHDEPKLVQSVDASLNELRATLSSLDKLAFEASSTLGQDSALVIQFHQTLEEVSRSARALRSLSETLDEQPESLLRGKQTQDGE